MRSRLSNERGVALAVAVFALVVIGALVAGIFFAGRVEQQSGRNTFYAAQAAEAADAGLSEAIGAQTATSLQAIAIDPTATTPLTQVSVGGNAHVTSARTITRLSDYIFLVRSTGTVTNATGGQLASRGIGQLMRLVEADMDVLAGLTALGDITISGGAQVSGEDDIPPTWSTFASQGKIKCPALDDVAGVRYNGGTLKMSGNGKTGGDPAEFEDPTLNATDMKSDFDKLKGLATLTLTNGNPAATAPAYTGNPARCDQKVETNWGEPLLDTDPCFNYFPIVYYYGNLKLQGGRGQGILLVEGDLTASGGMVFYGPVFVTGTLSTTGNSNQGAKFYGGVIAGNVALDDVTKLAGGALVNYSSCAVRRALQNTAVPTAFAERGWVQLYQ